MIRDVGAAGRPTPTPAQRREDGGGEEFRIPGQGESEAEQHAEGRTAARSKGRAAVSASEVRADVTKGTPRTMASVGELEAGRLAITTQAREALRSSEARTSQRLAEAEEAARRTEPEPDSLPEPVEGRAERAGTDSARSDAARSDAARSDAARSEAARSEAARSEAARSEAGRSEAAGSNETRDDAALGALAGLLTLERAAEAPREGGGRAPVEPPQDPIRRGAPQRSTQVQSQARATAEPTTEAASRAAAASDDGEAVAVVDHRALADRLAQADRVEQTLRMGQRPATHAAPTLVSDLATAVRRALQKLSSVGEGASTPLEATIGAQDGAALTALLARSDAPAAHLIASRAAPTMPTPSQPSHNAAMQMWELPTGEPGMVLRLGGDAGQLEVRVLLEGQKLQVRVRADDPAGQTRLQEALPELKRALERLPEVAAHGGQVDVRDESPGRGRDQQRGATGADGQDEDDSMADALGDAMSNARRGQAG